MTTAPSLILQTEEPESELVRKDHSIERFLLIILTLIGGTLRFLYLNRPTISSDEAALYVQVTRPFLDLARTLDAQHLAPLHYELYWLVGKFFPLNPYVLRLLPALAGTLLIPAVYWLAKQIVSIRAAMLAAAITAFSGYLLPHARDAQFQTPFWLLTILNIACFLHWLRQHNARAYLAWIATGAAMLGWSHQSAIVLPLELVIFLTYPHWGQAHPFRGGTAIARFLTTTYMLVLFLIGLVIIPSATVYYLFSPQINSVLTQTPLPPPTTSPTTAPITPTSPPPSPQQSASLALMGWYPNHHGPVDIRATEYLSYGLQLIALLILLTLLPWPTPKVTPLRSRRPQELARSPYVRYSYQTDIPPHERLSQSIWRIALWLGTWIIIPTYALHCIESPDSASPRDLALSLLNLIKSNFIPTLAIAAVLTAYCFYWIRKNHPITRADLRPGIFPLLQITIVTVILLLLCITLARTLPYLNIPPDFLPHNVGFTFAPIAILLATLIFRIRWNLLRRLGILILLAANITQASFTVIKNPNPRADILADDLTVADIPNSPIRTYVNIPKIPPTPDYTESLAACTDYYLALRKNPRISITPTSRKAKPADPWATHQALTERAAALNAAMRHAEQLILWDCVESPTPTREGTLEDTQKWKLAAEQRLPVFNPETWQRLYTLRRRIYISPGTPSAAELPKPTKDKEQQDVDAVLDALDRLHKQVEEQSNPKSTTHPATPPRPAKPTPAQPRRPAPPPRRPATRPPPTPSPGTPGEGGGEGLLRPPTN
jgi:hypothetical protein